MTTSRVVPATGDTMAASCCASALSSVDLPAQHVGPPWLKGQGPGSVQGGARRGLGLGLGLGLGVVLGLGLGVVLGLGLGVVLG